MNNEELKRAVIEMQNVADLYEADAMFLSIVSEYMVSNNCTSEEAQKVVMDMYWNCRFDDYALDISTLKKRIKHCRNPFEKKELQRQLNDAYKKRKARRN